MGISYVTAEGHQLPSLTCVRIPDGVDDLTVRKRLLAEWGIEIGGGLGSLKGKAWRIDPRMAGGTGRDRAMSGQLVANGDRATDVGLDGRR